MIINVNDLIEELQKIKDKNKSVVAVNGLLLCGEVFEVNEKDSYVELVLTD